MRKKNRPQFPYDASVHKPVIKCSICNGEQVAGFRDLHSGIFTDVMLIRSDADLRTFMEIYGITNVPEKIY